MKNNLSFARRKFLQYGVAALGTTVVAKKMVGNSVNAESINNNSKISNKDITPDEALNLLIVSSNSFRPIHTS